MTILQKVALSRRQVTKGCSLFAASALAGSVFPPAILALTHSPSKIGIRQDLITFQQDPARVSALEVAIGAMQDFSAKDPADPRGWLANAKAHEDFCSVKGFDPRQIHFCWWFLSWHRAYIAVTEWKLSTFAKGQAITFPYWNWSSDRRIPASFARIGSPLAKAIQFTQDRDIENDEVDYFPDDPRNAKFGVAALRAKSFVAATPAQIRESFGGIARPNPSNQYGNTSLEGGAHGSIHNYVGGTRSPVEAGDMSDFTTAARDPIFFAHHGNLDRLWETWRSDPNRKASEPSTDNFLKHKFPFTWIDGTTLEVSVEDTLNTGRLGYTYDTLDVFRPAAVVMAGKEMSKPDAMAEHKAQWMAAESKIEKTAQSRLPPIASQTVAVPPEAHMPAMLPSYWTLEIDGIEPPDRPMNVSVFIKSAADKSAEPGVSVGSFAAVKSGGSIAFPDTTLSFDVSHAIKQLQTTDVSVSLIPSRIGAENTYPYPPLKFESMKIVPGRP